MYNETDITWSSIENHYKYKKVNWVFRENGIPRYILFDENGERIEVKR